MNSLFANKTVIITGASSGIGRATALLFARQGAKLALAARNTQALESLVAEIQKIGSEAFAQTTDVTQRQQVEALVQSTLERWGRIDLLVSNAGQYIRSPIGKLTPEVMEDSMAVNFYSHMYAILAVLPHMLAQKDGHITIVASMDGKTGLPLDAPYVAAKFATAGFNDVLRRELYQTGVHTTIAYPGRVDTPMIADIKVPWISAKISPEAVAKALLKGIQHRRKEIFLPPQVLLLYVLTLFPGLSDWATRAFHLEGWQEPKTAAKSEAMEKHS
jgi:NADP-dependent 3-hydroxy acid dehydrogenase YdfG